MFGRKKKKTQKKSETPSVNVTVIPDVFYGGNDPEIYTPKKKHAQAVLPKKPKEKRLKDAAAPKKDGLLANKKVRIGLLIALFIIAVGGISWYYVADALRRDPAPEPTLEVPEEPVEPVVPMEEASPTTTPVEPIEEPVATSTPTDSPDPLEFPRILLGNSSDIDADALTDVEEEIFNTDSGEWDTDGDGFFDGQEVRNLYNPNGIAPQRLIDSGYVQEYSNPTWGYRVYYPRDWVAGAVDPNAEQVLLSAITGDFVEIRAFEKPQTQDFPQWFSFVALGQQFTDLRPVTNRFKFTGFMRTDELVAYFLTDTRVYVLIYHPGTTGDIPFRHIMQMMIQSFRPTATTVEIPDQVGVPTLPPPSIDELIENEVTTTDAVSTST